MRTIYKFEWFKNGNNTCEHSYIATFLEKILRIADGNKDAKECVSKILEDKRNILFVLTLDSKHIYGSQLADIYIANGKDIAKTMTAIKEM